MSIDSVDMPVVASESLEATMQAHLNEQALAAEQQEDAPVERSAKALDFGSHELYPELGGGAAKAIATPSWGNGGSAVKSAPPVVDPEVAGPTPQIKIPGRMVEVIDCRPQDILPRDKMPRPISDTMREINRKSRAQISMSTLPNGCIRFEAVGPQEDAQRALTDLIKIIGAKSAVTFSIPQSVRPFIIGKQGATIKALEEKTGARITFPKAADVPAYGNDDDAEINVTVEGNTLCAAMARDRILKIVKERGANASTKLRGIPDAFFPFISGPEGVSIATLEKKFGVKVHMPPVNATAPVGNEPFAPSTDVGAILLSGDRNAVAQAKAAIEARAASLQKSLARHEVPIERGRQQYLFGGRGPSMDAFFKETGCCVLPAAAENDDVVVVIGPASNIRDASQRFEELAMAVQCAPVDITRIYRDAPGGPAVHAKNITRYLKSRNVISDIESTHNAFIDTPQSEHSALPWQVYVQNSSNIIPARSEINSILAAYPPSRVRTYKAHDYFYDHLGKTVSPEVLQNFGVYMVVPEVGDKENNIVFVYESSEPAVGKFEVSRTVPTNAEVSEFKAALDKAYNYVDGLVGKHDALGRVEIKVPLKIHGRFQRWIKAENQKRPEEHFPLVAWNNGPLVTVGGSQKYVNELAQKMSDFVLQEMKDEQERGFTLSFDFPQKFANHLIGKGGSKIRELRERFDVEIQVQDGKVELKGPQAKCNTAKNYILSLAKTLADETTRVLRIEPKFHRELIGAQGSTINRLQTRYNVRIIFPRAAKSAGDSDDGESDGGKPQRGQANDEVLVRGPSKGVDSAYDEIYSLYQYLKETSFTSVVVVKQKQVPSIIGQSGSSLDQLRQTTGARIDIPANRDTETVEITIKGTKAQVQAAEKILKEQRAVFEDTIVRTIEVDRKHHKTLIGTGGSGIRELVAAAGGSTERRDLARAIQFPKQDSDGNTVKLEGRSEVVEKLFAAISAKVEEWSHQITDVIDVPTDKHRALIGRGGEVKHNIETKYSVSIEIPRIGDDSTAVKITGRPENVEPAKEHIAAFLKEQEGETVMIPRAQHHVISNNGQIFRRFRNDFNVRIDHAGQEIPPKPEVNRKTGGALPLITDSIESQASAHLWETVNNVSSEVGEIPWVLHGSAENVEKAKKALQTALAQAKAGTVTAFLTLADTKNYRFIIGSGGSKVKSIRSQSGCKINVPQANAEDQAIEIVGSEANVEKARELILQAVEDGTEKLDYP